MRPFLKRSRSAAARVQTAWRDGSLRFDCQPAGSLVQSSVQALSIFFAQPGA